jgi:hypothetical protein
MYGQSPYGSPMNRGMFMDPQMRMMLQMRDQMRAQYAPQPTEMPQQVTNHRAHLENMQMPLPALANAEPVDRRASLGNQVPMPQEQTTEQTLEELQSNILQMQQQQQRLSEHLGAGSGMLRQLQQPQQGLGGLLRQYGRTGSDGSARMSNQGHDSRMYTQGPESMRLQAFPVAQGNPFGG